MGDEAVRSAEHDCTVSNLRAAQNRLTGDADSATLKRNSRYIFRRTGVESDQVRDRDHGPGTSTEIEHEVPTAGRGKTRLVRRDVASEGDREVAVRREADGIARSRHHVTVPVRRIVERAAPGADPGEIARRGTARGKQRDQRQWHRIAAPPINAHVIPLAPSAAPVEVPHQFILPSRATAR